MLKRVCQPPGFTGEATPERLPLPVGPAPGGSLSRRGRAAALPLPPSRGRAAVCGATVWASPLVQTASWGDSGAGLSLKAKGMPELFAIPPHPVRASERCFGYMG